MNQNPRISIIVPIYKVENYLERCINSILNQTFKDYELLLIDDGSPDNCANICDKFSKIDSRIKVIHQQNHGVAYTRNVGISLAKGEYVTFVDSDDYVDKDFLSELYNKAEQQKLDFVYCNYFRCKSNKQEEITEKECHAPMEAINASLEGTLDGYLWLKLIRNSILKENCITFEENINLWEDIIFTIKVLFSCKSVGYVNKCLYYYNTDNQNSYCNKNYQNRNKDLLNAENYIEEFLKNNNYCEIEYIYKLQIKVVLLIFYSAKTIKEKKKALSLFNNSKKIYKNKEIQLHNRISLFFYCNNCSCLGFVYENIIKFLKKITK